MAAVWDDPQFLSLDDELDDVFEPPPPPPTSPEMKECRMSDATSNCVVSIQMFNSLILYGVLLTKLFLWCGKKCCAMKDLISGLEGPLDFHPGDQQHPCYSSLFGHQKTTYFSFQN